MNRGFRVGQIFGINIHVDWSWLFIFFLVTWNLTAAFGQYHPAWGVSLRWGTAVAAALLFFASVLAHELAHSLVAQARGIPVRSITLFLFGGVSNIQRHPDSPKDEFYITIVGPLTSLALGVVFTLLSGLGVGDLGSSLQNPSQALGQMGPVSTLLLWLGPVNITLGIFNLIPGFPLDGGRVLRSILWGATASLRRATRWASLVGQGVAWLLIVAGVAMAFGVRLPFFGTGVVSGLWLAFIGWFLNSASTQSYRQLVVQDVLEDVPVSRMMRRDPPTAPRHISIEALVEEYMLGRDDQSFPVMEGERLVGLITLDDVRAVPRPDWGRTTVAQAMTPRDQLVTIQADECADEALNRLTQQDIRQLPVMEGERMVGLLRRRDLIRWLQLQSGSEFE